MSPVRFLPPAAVVLAGLLAYSSAFPGAFVFDDAPNVSRNPQLDRPLDYLPGGPGCSAQPGRAVTFATFALDRAVALTAGLLLVAPPIQTQAVSYFAQLGDLSAARREVEAIRPLAPGIASQLQGYLDTSFREKP